MEIPEINDISWIPEKNLMVHLPDEHFPYEFSLTETLSNNTQTDIVVADSNKKRSNALKIDYSLQRDDEMEAGVILISNNGTSVSISNPHVVGDDVGVTFGVNLASNGEIELQCTLDDDVDGIFTYNISRT